MGYGALMMPPSVAEAALFTKAEALHMKTESGGLPVRPERLWSFPDSVDSERLGFHAAARWLLS